MSRTREPLTRPGTLAEVLRRARRDDGIDETAFRVGLAGFLDTFYLDPDAASRRTRVEDDPGLTGEPVRDAFLGAVGEHLCSRWQIGTAPGWTDAPERFLNRFVFMGSERMKPFLLAESPSAFRRRMIMIEAEPLRRARMPRDGRWWAYEEMRSGLTPGHDPDEAGPPP